MGGKRILLVDDDDMLCRSLGEQLARQEDFAHVVITVSAAETMALLQHERFDIVLLDVALPDEDGRELCRMLRAQGISVPIIMLTGADSEHDTITGLDAGANDYVTKPFRLNVLLARMRAHLRSHEHSDAAVFPIAHYTFHPATKLLMDDRHKIRLTEKEVAILKFLLRAGNTVVPRDVLLHEVWGYNPNVTTHTLETHIYRLRQKMEQDPSKACLLLTEPGGYRLAT
ncbi:MAG: response regulator receiver [Rhodospirillaceae bacterium]|nr:MAG: response regulator receiver [Rhodospirillaceae bacterium]